MEVVAQKLAEAVVSCLILGLAISAVAWLLARTLPLGRAGLRFRVWFGALGAIALVPALQSVLQGLGGLESGSAGSGVLVLPSDWAVYLLYVWTAITSIALARVLQGAWHVRKLRASSAIVDTSSLDSSVREAIEHASLRRKFELRSSDQVHVPMAIGFLRPAVIFPADVLSGFQPEQLRQLVLHESAHLLRYDDWTNLLQKIVGALLFFHPAVWWLEKKLSLEREMACDEAVVAQTSDARAYAECLASLAERTVLRRTVALVQAAASRLRQTSLRVEQLLRAEKPVGVRSWGAVVSLIALVSCTAVLVRTPELISFRKDSKLSVANESDVATVRQFAPRAIPAMMRESAHPSAVFVKHTSNRTAIVPQNAAVTPSKSVENTVAKRTDQRRPRVVMAHASQQQPIPVLLATTMVVERGTPDGGTQVWIVRSWRVAMYYPGRVQSTTQRSQKI